MNQQGKSMKITVKNECVNLKLTIERDYLFSSSIRLPVITYNSDEAKVRVC